MGNTQDANGVANAAVTGERKQGRRRAKTGNEVTEAEAAMDAAEHLTRDLARVRAKFGMDPVLATRSLATAWMTETVMEEDEAEFVDTMADCLGAGLSLEDALTCWDRGELTYDVAEEPGATDQDDEPIEAPLSPVTRPSSGAHRVLVR